MKNSYVQRIQSWLTLQGFQKKGASSYKAGPDSVVIVNFQKSDYDDGFYVNVGIWLRVIESVDDIFSIKSNTCHLSFRMEGLVPEYASTFQFLIVSKAPELEESKSLNMMLDELLGPLLAERLQGCSTLEGLKKLFDRGLVSKGLIHKAARHILQQPS